MIKLNNIELNVFLFITVIHLMNAAAITKKITVPYVLLKAQPG